jgi:hypothetical protein
MLMSLHISTAPLATIKIVVDATAIHFRDSPHARSIANLIGVPLGWDSRVEMLV